MRAVIVLAAGKGTRMRSELPKVLHPLLGQPLLGYPLDLASELDAEAARVVVVGHGRDRVRAAYEGCDIVWATQDEQLGTGHAAACGVDAFAATVGDAVAADASVVVLNGDLPLLGIETVRSMVELHEAEGADATLLTCVKENPTGFGRIVRDAEGRFRTIVEEPDADEATRAVREVNVGTYVFRGAAFREFYAQVSTDNEQGEYYLPDVAVLAAAAGRKVLTFPTADDTETAQVNSRAEMAVASRILRDRILADLMDAGVAIDDPASTYIEPDVTIGRDTRVHPFCVLRRGVRIGEGCEVGPFAHLRAGTVLEDGAEIGNFVEVKNSSIGPGTKAKHLTYIGDGEIGSGVNIGAGTIFANYDGRTKERTVVGDGAFVGSGSILVAPVRIGKRAVTGAGAVVLKNRDVADGETAIGVPARSLRAREGGESSPPGAK